MRSRGRSDVTAPTVASRAISVASRVGRSIIRYPRSGRSSRLARLRTSTARLRAHRAKDELVTLRFRREMAESSPAALRLRHGGRRGGGEQRSRWCGLSLRDGGVRLGSNSTHRMHMGLMGSKADFLGCECSQQSPEISGDFG